MKKTVLREYAKLIVKSGINVQKGQEVIVYADLDQPEFVQMVVEEAYKCKAKKVTVEWNYQPLQIDNGFRVVDDPFLGAAAPGHTGIAQIGAGCTVQKPEAVFDSVLKFFPCQHTRHPFGEYCIHIITG